ncbi:MAG: aldehyde dehydrogenase family protein [Actinomycetota bacterium]
MHTDLIDDAIAELRESKDRWAGLPIARRIQYLESIRARTVRVARPWVEAAVEAKGLSMDHPLAGEEWTSGPFSVMSIVDDLLVTLRRIASGTSVLDGYKVRQNASDQVVVDVFPNTMDDLILWSGVSAEVWMQPSVTPESLQETVGAFYEQDDPTGDVSVVLAAGNISSIAALDLVYAMFNEGKVVALKMNPVNDYTGGFFEEIFADLIDDGYVRFIYGGIRIGSYLTSHPGVDSIHITGSARTYDAIVYGTGAEGAENKKADTPINTRPIGAELGGVGPVIVVPGNWSRRDITFQAEHIVSQKMHNSGHNCIAAQVLILPEHWEQREALLAEIRRVLEDVDDRVVYYPESEARCEGILADIEDVETFGVTHNRYLFPAVSADDGGHRVFAHEVFGPALAVVTLPSPSVGEYLDKAVQFANESLYGTLGANVIIHPRTQSRHADELENALADLEYGTIAVNLWTGAAYFISQCAWGAFPGHTRQDIGSGVGVVHNTLMFNQTQKSIVRGPFAPHVRAMTKGEYHLSPKLIYFVTNKQAHRIGEYLIDYKATGSKAKLAKLLVAALRA